MFFRYFTLMISFFLGINFAFAQTSYMLDVRGESPNMGGILQLGNQDANHFLRLFPGHNQDPRPYLYFHNLDTFQITSGEEDFSNSKDLLTVLPSGQVGLGISRPRHILHLHDTAVFYDTVGMFVFPYGNPNYLQITNCRGKLNFAQYLMSAV